MTEKVVHYFRKNRVEAVIYVRGHNEEFQEMMCRLYAADKDYEVVFVTNNLEDVKLCDILLVASPSRISRDRLEHYKIIRELNEKGIEVEYAIDADNVNENISFLMNEIFSKKDKQK